MNPRWPYSADKGKLKKGPWTFEEDLRLLRYIRLHGEGRWSALAKAAGLQRCGKSCRLRWVNYLRPDLKRGNITPEEEQVIIDLHARWGNRWSLIAERMPGRTDNEIKNYWRCHLKKKLQRDNISTVEYNANDESPFPSPLVEQQLTTSGNTTLDALYEEKHCSASASASASLVLYEEKHCSASASASLVLYEEKHCSASASASASLVYEDKPLLVSSSTADEEIHRKGNSDLEDYNYMAQRGGGVNGYEGIEVGGINESVLDAPPSILYRFPSGIPIEDDAAARVLQVPSRANSNADYNIGCEVEYWGLDVGADIMLWNLCSTPNSISQCESHSPFSYAHHM